jgi:hypothetical protein
VKILRSTARSMLLNPAGQTLPQRFTLEIDVLSPATATGRAQNRRVEIVAQ